MPHTNRPVAFECFNSEQVHREVCALLIEVLKSLNKCLADFNSVLSKQWTSFVDAKTTDNNDLCRRLSQINAPTDVRIFYG